MNANDRKIVGIGILVVSIAIIGSIAGSTPYVPPESIPITKYKLSIEYVSSTATITDSTTEGQSTTNSVEITIFNITKVVFEFSYTDDYPGIFTGDNDEFEITVTTPNNETKTATVSQGSTTATIEFDFPIPPSDILNMSFDSLKDAEAKASQYLNTTGTGMYMVEVKATNCPGRRLISGIFDLDTGNDWTIKVSYDAYIIDIAKVGSEKGSES